MKSEDQINDEIDQHLRRAEVHARHDEPMAQMIHEKQAEVLYWVLGELDEVYPVRVSAK